MLFKCNIYSINSGENINQLSWVDYEKVKLKLLKVLVNKVSLKLDLLEEEEEPNCGVGPWLLQGIAVQTTYALFLKEYGKK